MLNILYLSHTPYEAGAEVSLRELVTYLDHQRFTPVVAAPTPAPYVEKLQKAGVECVDFKYHWKSYVVPLLLIWDLIGLICLIRRTKPNVIHANSRVTTILLGLLYHLRFLAHSLRRAKFINHVRDKDPLPGWKLKLINSCDQIIANSEQVKKFLVDGGCEAAKIEVIYNGVDLARFNKFLHSDNTLKPASTAPDGELSRTAGGPVSTGGPIITTIGQIYPRKGFKYLIEALAEIVKVFPNIRLQIVGQDPTESQINLVNLQVLAKELKVVGRIDWMGYRNNIPEILSNTDIFVLPSLEEPFGRVIIEAMAMELPVVATRVGGIPEIVTAGETGFLVPPKDAQQLVDKIVALLKDPELMEKMGKNGRKRVEEKFSLKEHVGKVEGVYDRMVTGKG